MFVGKELHFATGRYAVVAYNTDSEGVNLALLLNRSEHTGRRFVVCTFREGDEEWNQGRYTDNVKLALSLYAQKAEDLGY